MKTSSYFSGKVTENFEKFFDKMEIPDHVDPPFRFMLTHHSGDVDPPGYL